ncbi:hypothetical protein AUC69_04540 [Methyloceanibacter superfactus]|uniref:Uncharacterized protein n=1 Tax=Methyloceanibacter superfactus TaxID=1774969 RepID=A0A1E3W7X2_9HYPH|nr:hypothetical protein AUC69_04540 [Methyloceanibacter superfactus]
MQPSAPKYAHKLPPLRDEAAKLSPGFSGPGLATLLERFNESPSEAARAAPFTAQPALPRGTDPARPDGAGRRKMPAAALAPTATAKSRLTLGSVVSVLAGVMLVPISFLFFLWWQDSAPQDKGPSQILTVESAPAPDPVVQPAQSASTSEAALAAPDGVETATRPSISPEPPQVATVDMPASLPLPAAVATPTRPGPLPKRLQRPMSLWPSPLRQRMPPSTGRKARRPQRRSHKPKRPGPSSKRLRPRSGGQR